MVFREIPVSLSFRVTLYLQMRPNIKHIPKTPKCLCSAGAISVKGIRHRFEDSGVFAGVQLHIITGDSAGFMECVR